MNYSQKRFCTLKLGKSLVMLRMVAVQKCEENISRLLVTVMILAQECYRYKSLPSRRQFASPAVILVRFQGKFAVPNDFEKKFRLILVENIQKPKNILPAPAFTYLSEAEHLLPAGKFSVLSSTDGEQAKESFSPDMSGTVTTLLFS